MTIGTAPVAEHDGLGLILQKSFPPGKIRRRSPRAPFVEIGFRPKNGRASELGVDEGAIRRLGKAAVVQEHASAVLRTPDETADRLVDPTHSRNAANVVERLFPVTGKPIQPLPDDLVHLRQARPDNDRSGNPSSKFIHSFGKAPAENQEENITFEGGAQEKLLLLGHVHTTGLGEAADPRSFYREVFRDGRGISERGEERSHAPEAGSGDSGEGPGRRFVVALALPQGRSDPGVDGEVEAPVDE